MALVTIFGIAVLWLAFRRKEWLLAVIAVIFGLMLASSGTDWGTTALKILTDISTSIDGIFTKG
jgi:TctA family transporter